MAVLFDDFYIDKKVLITGHTGFKGAWLALWLLHLGAKVGGYSLAPPTNPNLFDLIRIENSIRHVLGDILDFDHVCKIFTEIRPEIVFHLAAQSLVRQSYLEPKKTYETNVIGTINILEAVRKTDSVRSVVIVTSDKCYENKEQNTGYKETDAMGGYDPYSSSKGCAELVTNAYRNSFFPTGEYGRYHHVAIASARAGNVIGGGDWAVDRLVPDCVRSISNGETILLRNPQAVRPWQHVLEPLSGYLLLGQKLYAEGPKYGQGWNFGPRMESTLEVEQLVKKIIEMWGRGTYKIVDNIQYHEANLLHLNVAKAQSHLGWHARLNVEEALRNTCVWYSKFYDHADFSAQEFCGQQIHEYTDRLVN